MKLDHVVWFTKRTPAQIAAQHEGAFVGGRHELWGTFNALKYVRNAYIEWLAIESMEVAKNSVHPLVTQLKQDLATYGEGWGTICISTDNIQDLNERLQRAGNDTSGVIDASRRTASGTLKKWKMLFVIEKDMTDLPAPFFIEWEEDEMSRRDSLRKEGMLTDESDSELIRECVFITRDVHTTLERWSALLGVDPDGAQSLLLDGVRLRFERNPQERNRMQAVVTGQAE